MSKIKKTRLSDFSRNCDAEIIEEKEDEMQTVIKCPYCGSVTTIGKTILDDAETEYLKAIIKPFRNRVKCIIKDDSFGKEFICIDLGDDGFSLPFFEPKAMYKGMELYNPYTLEELGL